MLSLLDSKKASNGCFCGNSVLSSNFGGASSVGVLSDGNNELRRMGLLVPMNFGET